MREAARWFDAKYRAVVVPFCSRRRTKRVYTISACVVEEKAASAGKVYLHIGSAQAGGEAGRRVQLLQPFHEWEVGLCPYLFILGRTITNDHHLSLDPPSHAEEFGDGILHMLSHSQSPSHPTTPLSEELTQSTNPGTTAEFAQPPTLTTSRPSPVISSSERISSINPSGATTTIKSFRIRNSPALGASMINGQ